MLIFFLKKNMRLLLPLPTNPILIFPILHSISMFSDSFLFGENLVTQYFLTFTCLFYLIKESNSKNTLLQFCKIIFTIIFTRLNGYFGHCREDSHRRICQPQILNLKSIKIILNKFNISKVPIISNIYILLGKHFIISFISHFFLCFINQQYPEIEYFLSYIGFFSTGHQFSFSELNIESGYCFSKHFNFFLSSLFIFLNTFLPLFISCSFTKNILLFYTYQSYSLFCICCFAFYGRNHLMIWQLIAPRFLFQCIYTLSSFLFTIRKNCF